MEDRISSYVSAAARKCRDPWDGRQERSGLDARSGPLAGQTRPSQVDQILANLGANARDAIDGVGKVIIETQKVPIDAACCTDHQGLVLGDYARLAVSDDGCGMDSETLQNIF